jgi:voltage-gated potassium channel
MHTTRNLKLALFAVALVGSIGTLGYIFIEGWSILDSIYMTVLTLATVGFREVNPLSPAGEVFTIFLMIFGIGIIAYSIAVFAQFMVEGQLQKVLGRRQLEKKIAKLSGHYIICGFGRIGSIICRELNERPLPFVVIEQHADLCEKIAAEGYLYMQGNATEDDVLLAAGIERARGLITVVTSDADNVYITLTARGLCPELFILSRAGDEGSEKKLSRAGATKVISPYNIGASRMAQAILRPSVMDFIEIATAGQNLELQLEEILVTGDSRLAGLSLEQTGVRKEFGLIIVGIRSGAAPMIFNPPAETIIAAGDILIALGPQPSIVKLENIARVS